MRRVLGDNHTTTCKSLSALAMMYVRLQRYDDAERAALAAYEGYRRSMGPDHEFTTGMISQLEKLYVAWGKPEEAAEWRAKLR